MTLLLGSIGWGLLTFGAITHVWHHARLRELLALHVDREVALALALTAAEVGFAVAIPVLVLADSGALVFTAGAAGLMAGGFIVWIARLLTSGSELPCACSFAETPTTVWSLARAAATALVTLLALAALPDRIEASISTMAVGLAVGGVVFVLPEALAWPAASKAMLARIDAHAPNAGPRR